MCTLLLKPFTLTLFSYINILPYPESSLGCTINISPPSVPELKAVVLPISAYSNRRTQTPERPECPPLPTAPGLPRPVFPTLPRPSTALRTLRHPAHPAPTESLTPATGQPACGVLLPPPPPRHPPTPLPPQRGPSSPDTLQPAPKNGLLPALSMD